MSDTPNLPMLPLTPKSGGVRILAKRFQDAVINLINACRVTKVVIPTNDGSNATGAHYADIKSSPLGGTVITFPPMLFSSTGGGGGTGGGGVNYRTANYTATTFDAGRLISFQSANNLTLTLPASPPNSTWFIAVQCIGTGSLTINRNGKTIDTAPANLILGPGQGLFIYTDGGDYFSQRTLPTNTAHIKIDNYTATMADSGLLFSFNAPTAKTLTLPAQPPPLHWNIFVENIAADLLTIDPNTNPTTGTTNLIDKTAGVIKLSLGQSIAIYSAYQLDNSGNPDPTVPLTYVTFGRPADIANFNTKIANGTGGSNLNGILVGGCIDTQGTFRRLEVVQLTTCEDRGDGTLENYTRLFHCSERFKLPGQ